MRIEKNLIGSMPIILFGGYSETSNNISYNDIESLAYETAKCLLSYADKIFLTNKNLKDIRDMLNINTASFLNKINISKEKLFLLENNNNDIYNKDYLESLLSLSGLKKAETKGDIIKKYYIVAYYNIDKKWEVYIIPKIKLPFNTLISEYCLQERNSQLGLNHITINKKRQRDNTFLWAVQSNGSTLDQNGDLGCDGLPSSMTEDEINFTRFKSLKDATIAALFLIAKNKKGYPVY